jgi:hypothetical protein
MEHTLAEQIQRHAAEIANTTTADNKGDGHNDVVALFQWTHAVTWPLSAVLT